MIARNVVIYTSLALGMAATYPLAMVGQFAVDLLYGDGQLLRESLYGYQRILAAKLVDGWIRSLVWVAAFWLAVHLLRRYLPWLYLPIALAVVATTFGLSLLSALPVPLMFAWLLLATVLLHGAYRLSARKLEKP